MELVILFDHRFYRSPGRAIYSPLQYGYSLFQKRYLRVFDSISILARVAEGPERAPGQEPTEGACVRVVDLGGWTGAWGFAKARQAAICEVRKFMQRGAAFDLIVPGGLASMTYRQLVRSNYPFAVEVVSDPHAVFAPGVVDHPLRPFFRWYFSHELREQCRHAIGASYVTKNALQARYAPQFANCYASDIDLPSEAIREDVAWTYYSSVALDDTAEAPCTEGRRRDGPWKLLTVGSLAQRYKGTDVLIDAVRRCLDAGLDLTAVIVGDGKYRAALMAQAEKAGVGSRVKFVGQVAAGEEVRRILDTADLFVLPSRTEGLPRALIEAMARGLPCIASAVGGIPELLDVGEMVPPGDPGALAAKIREVLAEPSRLARMARRNLATAQEYRSSAIDERRQRFYQHLRDRTSRFGAGSAAQ